MFTISRSPLSGFLPVTPTREEISMRGDKTRVSSVSTDLLPELLSWSAIIDMTQRSVPGSPLPQKFPSDILEEDSMDDESSLESHSPLSLSRIFDPTTLAIGFDLSYLDGLDEQLIYSPKDAFADLCWSDGVYNRQSMFYDLPSPLPQYFSASDESGTEESESNREGPPILVLTHSNLQTTERPRYDRTVKTSPISQDYMRDYLSNFERHFNPNQGDSVGSFPVPSPPKQKKSMPSFHTLRSQLAFGR